MGFRRMIAGAVLAAVWGASAFPAAAAPKILYELLPRGSATVASFNRTATFDVLALVTGTNLGASAFDNGQFTLTTSNGGLLGDLSFTIGSTYDPAYNGASHNNVFVGNVPTPTDVDGDGDMDLGPKTGGTGANNDTIIAGIGIGSLSTALAAKSGTQIVGGVTYNVFPIGTGVFTATGNVTFGASTEITLTPRGGLGTLIKPQVAFVDGVYTEFNGNDTANVGVVSTLTIQTVHYGGEPDANDDGFVNSTDFGILVNNYLTETTLGYHAGDFNGDGHVDSTDFGILVNSYLTGPNPHAGLEPSPAAQSFAVSIPEPASLTLCAIFPLLAMRRRSVSR